MHIATTFSLAARRRFLKRCSDTIPSVTLLCPTAELVVTVTVIVNIVDTSMLPTTSALVAAVVVTAIDLHCVDVVSPIIVER